MKRFTVMKGPDRMELMSNFMLRNPAKFMVLDESAELGKDMPVEVVINGISMESADCHSWLIQGYILGGVNMGNKVEGFYKTHPKLHMGVVGYLDVTLSPTGKSEIG